MSLSWSYNQDDVDWDELSDLYRVAPLGDKKPGDLKKAFANSLHKCFIKESGKLIGAGRVLADGVDCAYICDLAVLPEYQGRGIGQNLLSRLIELSKGHKKIILYAYPGKESFYKKLGFKRMNTAMAIFENQNQAIEWGLVSDS